VAGDIRFTAKGDSLYAIALAWPEGRKLLIRSLGSDSQIHRGPIARIGLLGSESNLVWSRSAEGVMVYLPEKPPCDYAHVFKINPLGAWVVLRQGGSVPERVRRRAVAGTTGRYTCRKFAPSLRLRSGASRAAVVAAAQGSLTRVFPLSTGPRALRQFVQAESCPCSSGISDRWVAITLNEIADCGKPLPYEPIWITSAREADSPCCGRARTWR